MLFDLWERYRTIVIVLGMAVVVVCAWMFYPGNAREDPVLPLNHYVHAMESEEEQVKGQAAKTSPSSEPDEADKSTEKPALKMYVDIKGSVQHPGLYQFFENDRVQHVITVAGGFLPDADISRVNLAQPLADGMVIWVPQKGDDSPPPYPPANCICQTAGAATTGASSASGDANGLTADGKINLNRATLQQLMTLPGVGETRAKAIITYREQNGAFSRPEELKNVTGIGEKTYAELANHIAAP
ncbi:helix-hairpin-helix domain-containing protein [Brevibacillus humidisoli]|uniref:helix-hairpin-helix domain-containing protein n=1 Tax=Brevibacillus humidisoli TaxID=2895522 RepID=UPI001E3F18D9|nr:helix-hairpin-helix domain-containing protein [Brevibacillus humidisoli]UFJ38888.1 helix-hairpin-helix domain-containing protein [Brevibacillus humidisoli]